MLFQPFSKGRISFSHKPSSQKRAWEQEKEKEKVRKRRRKRNYLVFFLLPTSLYSFHLLYGKAEPKNNYKNILVDNTWRNIFFFTKIHLFFGWFPRFALAVEVVMCRQKIPGYLETKWRKRKGKRRRQRPFDRNFLTFFSGRGIACPFAVCQKNRPPLFWFINVSDGRI